MIKPVNITQVRSPLPSQLKPDSKIKKASSIFHRSGINAVELLELGQHAYSLAALSPEASTRSIFGTHRHSEAVTSRNLLEKIIAKTIPVVDKGSGLYQTP